MIRGFMLLVRGESSNGCGGKGGERGVFLTGVVGFLFMGGSGWGRSWRRWARRGWEKHVHVCSDERNTLPY